jgi:hypothetical protein
METWEAFFFFSLPFLLFLVWGCFEFIGIGTWAFCVTLYGSGYLARPVALYVLMRG